MGNNRYEFSFSLPKPSSIFTCECFALWKALEFVFESLRSFFVIFTDSQSLTQSLFHNGLNSTMHPIIGIIRELICNIKNSNKHPRKNWKCKKNVKKCRKV